MEHQVVLYDEQRRVVDQVITQSWEQAQIVLVGWNKRYGDDFTILYKRYKGKRNEESI
jgi:hypothetical protein